MTTIEKVALINEALVKSGAAVKEQAKAEIVNGKVLYSKVRQNATCATKIRLTFREIIWMTNSNDIKALIRK